MKLSQGLNTNLSQKQKLVLSMAMKQYIELIQLPVMDLRERIYEESMQNPALDIIEKKKDSDIEKIENSFEEKNNISVDSSSAKISTGVSPNSSRKDSKRQFLEGAISTKTTLADHLEEQLNVQDLTDKEKEIGKTIISLINSDGFFKEDLSEIFTGKDLELAKAILEIIQLFDPPGIASKNEKESLLFQLESLTMEELDSIAYEIVKNYFEAMSDRRDKEIIKALKIKQNELKEAYSFLSNFPNISLYPGREFSSDQTNYVVPDAFIYIIDNELEVKLNGEIIPKLKISEDIKAIAKQVKRKNENNKKSKDLKYVKNKIKNAEQFISMVKLRNDSLEKLLIAIITHQKEFFFKGPKFLAPLKMKEIAEEIGYSESTVSRLSSSKYVQTDWGLHPIKYFFSNSISTTIEGNNKSSESIREMIKEIIIKEKENKISDQKIADILKKKGITIARRTVSKYRKMLNILPSSKRKI